MPGSVGRDAPGRGFKRFLQGVGRHFANHVAFLAGPLCSERFPTPCSAVDYNDALG